MIEYLEMECQIDIRLDGKYYCRTYQHCIPGSIAMTDDYDDKDDAIEATEAIILEYQTKGDDK